MLIYVIQYISRDDDYKRRDSTWEKSTVEVFADYEEAYMAACRYLSEVLFESGDLDYCEPGDRNDVPSDKGAIEQYFRKKFPEHSDKDIFGLTLSCGGTLHDPMHAFEVIQALIPWGEYINAYTEEVKVEEQEVIRKKKSRKQK